PTQRSDGHDHAGDDLGTPGRARPASVAAGLTTANPTSMPARSTPRPVGTFLDFSCPKCRLGQPGRVEGLRMRMTSMIENIPWSLAWWAHGRLAKTGSPPARPEINTAR